MTATETSALHSPGPSGTAALAGFLFAMKPMITLVAVRVLSLTPQEGSGLGLLAAFALFLLALFLTFGRSSTPEARTSPVKWAWAYLALAGASLFWGQAASPLVSGAYWLGTVCEFGAVLLILRGAAAEQNAILMMKAYVLGALVVAATGWLMPMQGDLRLGDEVYFNSNNIAYVCAFAVFFVQYVMRRHKKRWGWLLVVLTATILRSLSKGTIAAFLLSEAWLLLKDKSISRRARILAGGTGLLLIVAFSGLFVAYFDVYTSSGNQAETLTGRTAIWAWAFSEALERPWFGHGFDSLWKVAPVFGTFEARHAENELLQQFYCFGLAGVLLAGACYVSVWRAVRRAADEASRAIWAALMIFLSVRGLVEAEPFDLLLPMWMIALLAFLADTGSCGAEAWVMAAPLDSETSGANVIRL